MKYVIFTLFFITPFIINAQSLYVLDTDKAFTFGPDFNNFDEVNDYGIKAGLTLKGRTDLYVQIGTGSFGEGTDFSRLMLTLGADYFLLKQNSGASFSWSFGGSYAPYKINSDELNGFDVSLSGSEIILGTDFYKTINLTSLRIIPTIGIGYNIKNLTAKSGGDKESDSDSRIIFKAGIDFDLNAGNNKIVIGPEVRFSEGYQGFGISLQYILVK